MVVPGLPGRLRALCFFWAAAFAVSVVSAGCAGPPPVSSSAQVESLLEQMSLAEKVGQMFLVGFAGTRASRELREMVSAGKIGGVVLYSRNISSPEQVRRLVSSLQRLALRGRGRAPLLVSTDQEGGSVSRFSSGLTVFPGNMSLGAAGSVELAYEAAAVTARQLRAVGVNMNLAPVLDVSNNPANPVIGARSYGGSGELVARLGAAQVRGYQENGVIATGKHFPGHGDTDADSHFTLPVIEHGLERLRRVELEPFAAAIRAGVSAIMTAHVAFPAVDPDGAPATLSRRIVTDLLRQQMGFGGVVVSDAMEMKAASERLGLEEAVVRAVEAGVDIILLAEGERNQLQAMDAMLAAVREGRIGTARIDEAARRILRLKARYGLWEWRPAAVEEDAVGEGLAMSIAEAAVTVVKDAGAVLPLRLALEEQVLVVTPPAVARAGDENDSPLRAAVGSFHGNIHEIVLGDEESGADLNAVVEAAARCDVIIAGTVNARRGDACGGQAVVVRTLASLGKTLIVVAFGNPYDLCCFPEVDTYLAAYSYTRQSVLAAVGVLFGALPARGRLPVAIPGICEAGHGLCTQQE